MFTIQAFFNKNINKKKMDWRQLSLFVFFVYEMKNCSVFIYYETDGSLYSWLRLLFMLPQLTIHFSFVLFLCLCFIEKYSFNFLLFCEFEKLNEDFTSYSNSNASLDLF